MRFLFDQSTDRRLAPYRKRLGHDVTIVAIDHPPGTPDFEVLAIAYQEQRILVTEDRDFGELVFRQRRPHSGVVYLRLPPMELDAKLDRLDRVLRDYGDRLDQFIVITPYRIRIRHAGSRQPPE